MKPLIIWALFVIAIITQYVESYSVLHKILKVRENASVEELKVAYEKLLQQWYKASRTFTAEAEILHLKILQAYRELKTQMEVDFHDKHLLSSKYYKSTVQSLGIETLQSISVPLTTYNEELLRSSHKNLHLVLFYSLNSSCSHIMHNWFNLLEILTPLGVVMVTINIDDENVETATYIIGEYPSSFPYLLLLIDGVSIPYNNEFIDFMILDFIRRSLPENLFQMITDISVKTFLNSWHNDNKVRALIYQPTLPIRLQYLLIIFIQRKAVIFGFINLADEKTRHIQRKMNISKEIDTFLLFKENPETPSVRVAMSSIPAKLINETILKNNFLTLPRITSQEMFDRICPIAEYSETRLLCVILVIQNSLHLKIFDKKIVFRRFVEEYSHYFNEVSFMYVYNDYQPGFNLPIEDNNVEQLENSSYIVALRRIDRNHVNYTLLMNGHTEWEDYENTKERLKISIEEIIKNKQTLLLNTIEMNNFVNENPPSLIYRIFHRIRLIINKITLEQSLPYIIFVATVLYFAAVFTTYWNRLQCFCNLLKMSEEEKYDTKKTPYKQCKKKETSSPEVFLKNDKCITPSRELRLHELKAETYNGMVRLLKPGCRTIVLMFDRVRADLLVSQYYKAVWPYRKNKNLLFGYVNMEKKSTLEWYSELVRACLPDEQQDIEINPYYCAGTVLALSGMRKYFCLYHLKHPGITSNKNKPGNLVTALKTTFSDEELLVGLRDWLDKLFDGSGSVIRYRVNHWPDFKIL